MVLKLPIVKIDWKPSWRIIPSRFPPVDLFARIADSADWEVLQGIEDLTNDRLREERGEVSFVLPEERISGHGTSIIMAAFTHINKYGSRFSDGSYGVLYVAHDLEIAVAETKFHRERFMKATNEPKMELDMRVYLINLRAKLHDARKAQKNIYNPDSYAASQELGRQLHDKNSSGVIFKSVRQPRGECCAGFTPKIFSNVRQERHLCYLWDGEKISDIYEKRKFISS